MTSERSNKPDFDDAVKFALQLLRLQTKAGPVVSPLGLSSGAHQDPLIQSRGLRALSEDPAGLVEKARRDADAHDALRMALGLKVFLGEPLPQEAREWLSGYLLGRNERPIAKSGRKNSLGAKFTIHWLVTILVDHWGLSATRNEASEGRSACDAVAQAMSQLGRKPASYERVRAVWIEVARMEECGPVAEPEEPTTID